MKIKVNKTIKVLILFNISLFLGTIKLMSQDMPNIVPPSPEASAMASFTDVPVSHYTGMPNISVPFYTIAQKGVNIPVSLNYHARGVKVSEFAPSTGMGWSLNYGGSVSRQVRGKPDEILSSGYFSNRNTFINYSENESYRDLADNNEIQDPSYDFYPDQFSFSVGGISGKFIFDYNDLEPVVQSYDDIIVDYTRENGNSGKIDSFQITDSKGNIYYFGISKDGSRSAQDYQTSSGMSIGLNNVITDPPPSSDNSAYSAWKLMDIETAYGELISYFYDTTNSLLPYYSKVYDKHISYSSSANTLQNIGNVNMIQTRLSKVWNYEKQLSKIEFNQGRDRIEFDKTQDLRADFNGYALDKISIYNQNKLIKAFKLNYKYTTSNDETNLLWYFKFQNSEFRKYFKRMFLSSIQEKGNNEGEVDNDGELPTYEFEYNEDYVLPSVFSSRQDYWGYYNGATDNGPFTRIVDYGNYDVDRTVDTIKSEVGILKKIKYPTGGETKFTYEHNRGFSPSYFNDIYLPNINPISTTTITLTKADFQYVNGGYLPYNISVPNHSVEINYRFNCRHLRDIDAPQEIPDCLFYFTINGNGGANAGYVNETVSLYSGANSNSISIGVHTPRFPGVPPDLHLDPNYDFSVTITYDNYDNTGYFFAAGKRIKKIEHIDENEVLITKEYEYKFANDIVGTGRPSGAIIGFPSFLNKPNENDPPYVTHTKYYDATSAYGTFQPNSIGYSSVIEYQGTKNENIGKTEYLYTNLADSGGDYYEFPYHPPTDNEWLRGKLIKIKKYEVGFGDQFVLKSEGYNKYKYGDIEYVPDFQYAGDFEFADTDTDNSFIFTPHGREYDWATNTPSSYFKDRKLFRLPLFMRSRFTTNGADIHTDADWKYRIYHFTGGTVKLFKTIQKDYTFSGLMQTETIYDYDYQNHYQVKGSATINSQNNTIIKKYYYPTDFNSLSGLSDEALNAAELLENKNIYNVLQTDLITTDQLNNMLSQNSTRTNYKAEQDELLLPKSVETLKGSNGTYDVRLEYIKYDDYGNVLEVKKESGTHHVYIWGYDNTHPIAKIENATYTDIEDLPGFGSGFQIQSGLSATQEYNLRNMLPNAMVTTYTYASLIGVTSITDPRGNTIYYEYDEFNRLKHVKDKDGNILSKNDYNYANQN